MTEGSTSPFCIKRFYFASKWDSKYRLLFHETAPVDTQTFCKINNYVFRQFHIINSFGSVNKGKFVYLYRNLTTHKMLRMGINTIIAGIAISYSKTEFKHQ